MPRRAAVTRRAETDTRAQLLEAAEKSLRKHGFSGLSTRRVAAAAAVPLSQIHYHFGSKEALILALLDHQNRRLVARQRATFAADLPLWQRWEKACDHFDEDIASGYVRVLQEMIAAGWSNPEIAAAVRKFLAPWHALGVRMAKEALARHGPFGSLTADDVAALVGASFMGSEALLLLGFEQEGMPLRRALRRFGALIRALEQSR
jgi:AcrR family transcriptional regulator